MKKNNTQINIDNIIIFNNSDSRIGYVARTSTQGKELDMVNRYVEFLINKYSKTKSKKVAIFIEPQIDTGYPDIVVVEYRPCTNLMWNSQRNNLNSTDLKLLFYIQNQKNLSLLEISETLGYPIDVVQKSVDKLSDCGLVHLSKNKTSIRNIQLKSYCRINKIIAIEAKIDKWNEAIRQANNNIWFSTESYILLNKESCSTAITDICQENGLGIILVNGKIETILEGDKRQFPVSYFSLQFNEWILRHLHREENCL